MALRRNLLLLATLATGGLAMVILAGFIWPETGSENSVNLGPAEDYPVGSVTMHTNLVDFTQGRWDVNPSMLTALGRSAANDRVMIALARYEDGTFGAFLSRDPRNGCTMPWRPNFSFEGSLGWFRDPCHGSTYDRHGQRVFGPSPRNMDYFDVEVNDAGEVVVDLRTLNEGAR